MHIYNVSADGNKSDLKKLNGDENIEVNKIGRESSTEQADGTSLTDDTEGKIVYVYADVKEANNFFLIKKKNSKVLLRGLV